MTSNLTKPDVSHHEDMEQGVNEDTLKNSGSSEKEFFEDAFQRTTIRRIDLRLLVILGISYAVSLVDRTNISSARVAGMGVDLALTVGDRYSIISLVFFAPYILFQIPSNLVLRKVGAKVWLTAIMLAWGAVMLGMGFIDTWQQLAACRVLLGVLEAGFYPGCVYLIVSWYTRYDTQKRLAAQYMLSQLFSGFGGIMSYGMSTLAGTRGLAGWRWIFILWGTITLGLAFIMFFSVINFPDANTFLTPRQTRFVLQSLDEDRQDAVRENITLRGVVKHLSDWKLWVISLAHCFSTLPAYAFALFMPVILAGAGYSTTLSLILPGPPYVFAALYTFAVAYISDKTRLRAPFIAMNAACCLVGLIILAWGRLPGVRYMGSFLVIAGCSANVPATLTYGHNNVRGQVKRAVATGIMIAGGGMGGIVASLIFRQADYPAYIPGLATTIACQAIICVFVGGLSTYFKQRNSMADRSGEAIEGSLSFRYTI